MFAGSSGYGAGNSHVPDMRSLMLISNALPSNDGQVANHGWVAVQTLTAP